MTLLRFFLSYNNGAESLQLPVNPERISVSSSRGYEDVEVTQLGEFTVFGNLKLRDFSFSSFFPSVYNPSYCEYAGFRPSWENVKTIERWLATGRPIRFTLTGKIYGDFFTEILNSPVTIRSFNYYEEGGAPGDVYYDISLKEYRFIEFRRIKAQTTSSDGTTVDVTNEATRSDTTEKAGSYVVVSGDTLFKIASRVNVYGNGDRWRDIYDANKALIGANPNLIQVGQTLVIPQ